MPPADLDALMHHVAVLLPLIVPVGLGLLCAASVYLVLLGAGLRR
jgi:hypothetical protein